ncbi:MAG TPA: hypothetical protein PKK06_00370 [Phycisphaerae bacterium]|nr:hypothetical protein [Phycisphaerae bacterium]
MVRGWRAGHHRGRAAVRCGFLDQPIRYDEAWNYLFYSSRTPTHILTSLHPNNHMLRTLLVRVASHWVGTSPAGLRVPALVAGVLLIPLTAWLAWTLCASRVSALLAALMVCASSPLVEYSTNSRGYTWLAVFAGLQVICTVHLVRTPARRWLWSA